MGSGDSEGTRGNGEVEPDGSSEGEDARPEADSPAEAPEESGVADAGSSPDGASIMESMLRGVVAYQNMQEQTARAIAPSLQLLGQRVSELYAGTNLTMAALNNAFNQYQAALVPSLSTVRALIQHAGAYPTLTRADDYAEPDTLNAYSDAMESPESYFRATEETITSFDDLHSAITTLISKTPELPLVWRGVRDAEWGLHSHLYRHLMTVNGVEPPSAKPKTAQPYPDEDQMVVAEREILRIARSDWRFDNLSALETFARVQHAGGPTRLIDVTKNPYIGAWFAVEFDKKTEGQDARLFALATKPVTRDGHEPPPDSALQLDDLGAARDPFWHLLPDNVARQQIDWGTGARRRVWVPPAYDPRISAQNAAFVLDGVPISSAKITPYFTAEKNVYWRRSDLLASASIYVKMLKPTRKPVGNVRNFAPTFSFRITADAKRDIRDVMESRFGYRLSYIYPDMAALADHLKTRRLDQG